MALAVDAAPPVLLADGLQARVQVVVNSTKLWLLPTWGPMITGVNVFSKTCIKMTTCQYGIKMRNTIRYICTCIRYIQLLGTYIY
jgi:hypothetical protein